MKLRSFVLMLVLLIPSMAKAGPISVNGVWTPTVTPGNSNPELQTVLPFWAGGSWDGPEMGIGYLINAYGSDGLEYFSDGTGNYTSFVFDGEILDLQKVFGITAWTGGVFGIRPDGAFTYDSGTGRVSNSLDNGGQYALFRHVRRDGATSYYLGVEDILLSEPMNDRDYNDYVVKFESPQPVPEPGTLLLLGSGMAALVARRKVAARKARGEATV